MGDVIEFPAHERKVESLWDDFCSAMRQFNAMPCKALAYEVEETHREWARESLTPEELPDALAVVHRDVWGRV